MFDSPSPRGRSGGWILPALFWTGLIVLGTAAASWWLSSSRGSKALEVMDGDTLELRLGRGGHYEVGGAVAAVPVRFIVDTGATMISLGASDARRIGLDASRGQQGVSNTANGQAKVTKVQLDTVQVGDITLHNVDALIHKNEMPMALLGMSFLNRMEMQRDGSTMTLKKRF